MPLWDDDPFYGPHPKHFQYLHGYEMPSPFSFFFRFKPEPCVLKEALACFGPLNQFYSNRFRKQIPKIAQSQLKSKSWARDGRRDSEFSAMRNAQKISMRIHTIVKNLMHRNVRTIVVGMKTNSFFSNSLKQTGTQFFTNNLTFLFLLKS